MVPTEVAAQRLRPFLPRITLEWMAERPSTTYQELEGSMVFVDISGFTKLSEKLAKRGRIGAEEMADAINGCFSELLTVAYAEGGSLLKFGGDALLLLFTGDTAEEHAARAVRAAVGMRRRLREVGRIETSGGRVTLRMSVGVHTGTYHLFLVGDVHRELIVTGPGASEVVEMEGTADAGEIVVSPATAVAIPESCVGVAKGPGWLLRNAPPGEPLETITVLPELTDELLERCVPLALREVLLFGSHEPEHRQVSIAFLHFDGTDELLTREGVSAFALELDRLVRDVQDAAAANEVSFLATDVDHDGGKIILTAGAPRSVGNDDERLLLAARRIADASHLIPVRIGINRGPVFVGDIGPKYRRTFTVMGDAVNLAARVMARAGRGEVLATAEVLGASRVRFDTKPLEPFHVKGKTHPVRASAVGQLRGGAALEREETLPLVGRAAELRALDAALAAAREGRGSLIEITGDPGVGKSRLLEEMVRRAKGFSIWNLACRLYESSTPYALVSRPLRDALEIRAGDSDEEALDRLRKVVAERAPELTPYVPLLAGPLDLPIPETDETRAIEERFRLERVQQTTAELLRLLLPQTALVAIEDANWMDEASAELLRHLGRRIGERSWIIAATTRPAGGGFGVEGIASAVRVELDALSLDEARSVLEAATDQDPLSPHVIEELARRSGGNPLFLSELLRAVRASTGLEGLPDTIEGLVTTQIDALRPKDRQLLRHASVLGDTFSEGLARVALAYELGGVDRSTWSYLDAFLVRAGPDSIRFRHSMVRDVAYGGLAYRRRRDLHAVVGDTIERWQDDPEDEAEILSLHFLHAGSFERAWRYALVAGHRAAANYANVDAASFFRRALEASRGHPVDDLALASVWEALGKVQERIGEPRGALRSYTEARRLVRGDTIREAELTYRQALVEGHAGRTVPSVRWASRTLRSLEGIRTSRAAKCRAQTLALLAGVRSQQGRAVDAVGFARRAIDEARDADDRHALARACMVLGDALYANDDPEAPAYSAQALALFRELGDLEGQSIVLNNDGVNAYWEGRWSDAVELWNEGASVSERAGDLVGAAVSECNVAEILADQGRLDEAEQRLRRGLHVFRGTDDTHSIAYYTMQLGRVLVRGGAPDRGRELLDDAIERFRVLHVEGDALTAEVFRAEALVYAGSSSEAIARVDELLGLTKDEPNLASLLYRVRAYASAQIWEGRDASSAVEQAIEVARSVDAKYDLLASLTAAIDLSSGRVDELVADERDVLLRWLDVVRLPTPPLVGAVGRRSTS